MLELMLVKYMMGGKKMKFNKKAVTMAAFVLGAVILVTSAFADIVLGSGYNSLKNSAKTTARKLTDEVDNFSIDVVIALKLDGKVVMESKSSGKFDIVNNTRETKDKNFEKGEVKEYYYYYDENRSIHKNDDGSYNVIEKRKKNNETGKLIENPFDEEQVKDAERVMDAFVGNLQDAIQVEESDGKKMYIGNLTEAQIPPIVNAISSFVFKYNILDQWQAKRLGIPCPKSNIYLANAMGKAIENEEGIIESGIFTASISAQDSEGIEHIYSLDFSIDAKDINNTVVNAPDLDGKKVTYSKEGFEFDSKYVGKYKNDIVIEKDNSFEKVGERFVEINSIENGNLKGKYYEVYREEYEADTTRNLDFYSNYDESQPHHPSIIQYTDNNGEKKKGIIHRDNLQNINISFNVTINEDNGGYSYQHEDGFDNTFIRVFE